MKKGNKQQARFDLEVIANFIKPKSKVLDVGCGNGELLHLLKTTKQVNGRGLEISQQDVSKAVAKGISVIQGNADKDLPHYPDNSFDYAILSQTIQAMKDPQEIMRQMLRIADFAVISLPNFAYFRNRFYLLLKGEMPVRKTIPYQWYDTPNIHFCSVNDFENLCEDMSFNITQKLYLGNDGKTSKWLQSKIFSNFFAEFGVFVITKNDRAFITESEFVFKKNNDSIFSKVSSGFARNSK
jgi:methionine biosynthesis protein MetW